MINILRAQYETLLLYNPNGTFLFLIVFFIFLIFLFFGGLFVVFRLFRSVGTVGKQVSDKHFRRKISIERFVLSTRAFLQMVDVMEQRVLKKIQEIVDGVAHEVLVSDHERDD